MDIQKLTKKNQEFIHIATNQLIKDGKSDQEIKDILGDIIPELIENQKKGITRLGRVEHCDRESGRQNGSS